MYADWLPVWRWRTRRTAHLGDHLMARFAIIDAGRVINHAEADSGFAASQGWIPAGDSRIGDSWDGEVFTPTPPEPPVVPFTVTRRQAKQALALNGLIASVQIAIDAIPNATQRALMQIEWDDSQEFQRNRPAVIAIGTAVGLDAAGIDALFIQAATL